MAAPLIINQQYMCHEVRKLVQQMGLYANNGLVAAMHKISTDINDLLTLPGFPPNEAETYRNTMESFYRYGFKRRVNVLMGEVVALRRGLVVESLDDLLDQVWSHVAGAEQYGAEPGYRRRIEDWLKSIMDTPFDQLSARLPGQMDGIGRVGGTVNRRRSRRFSSPSLTVVIDNQVLTTVDWSPFGLCVKGVRRRFSTSDVISLAIRPSIGLGIKGERARVVRYVESIGLLALEFFSISSAVLNIMHELRIHRIPLVDAP